MQSSQFSPLERAVASLQEGKPIILLDDPQREGEGDFVLPALHAVNHPERLQYHLRFGAVFCVSLPIARLQTLGLPQAPYYGKKDPCNAYAAVDARAGHSGISARDRALAIEALLYDSVPITDPFSQLDTRGHTTPLGAKLGGVLERQGHTEGSLDLMRLANLPLGAVLAEVKDPKTGDPMSNQKIPDFARALEVPVLQMHTLVEYLQSHM